MLKYLLALALLTGGVAQTDEPGRIGIRWDVLTHSILRVYKGSPADIAGIHKGDKVISDIPEGLAGTLVSITVVRQGQKLTFEMERVAYSAISKQVVDE